MVKKKRVTAIKGTLRCKAWWKTTPAKYLQVWPEMPVSPHNPLHLPGRQRAASYYCLWPRPLIPFNAACSTTKGNKLGSRLDDRVTNPFRKTDSICCLYS